MHGIFTINAYWTKGHGDPLAAQRRASMISSGAAKITTNMPGHDRGRTCVGSDDVA
jgi:hypothetical protein